MKKWVTFSLLIVLVGISSLVYVLFYQERINPEEEAVYTFLIDSRDEENQRTSLYVLFYHYPEPFLLAFQISDKLMVPHPNTRQRVATPYIQAHSLGNNLLENSLHHLYGITVDFTFTVSTQDAQNLLRNLGGTAFLNLYAEHLEKGVVFLDEANYLSFLKSIPNKDRLHDTALGIWYTALSEQLRASAEQPSVRNAFMRSLNSLSNNLNLRTLQKITSPLIDSKGELYFTLIRSNLEETGINGETLYLPLEDGSYDRRKIATTLTAFRERAPFYEQFPITMQIKNTTSIKRFAARTAGVLRVRKINVKEYLNSSIDLQHSILLDFAHSPIKTEYIKKITRVDHVHPLFDTRENLDFALYIADDYYGIQLLKEQQP